MGRLLERLAELVGQMNELVGQMKKQPKLYVVALVVAGASLVVSLVSPFVAAGES